MQLYHGSGPLANANVEFPAGPDFYKPYDIKSSKRGIDTNRLTQALKQEPGTTVEYQLSKIIKVNAAWFANPTTAKTYSQLGKSKELSAICDDGCINVYELTEDAVFIVLDNNFNIYKLLSSQNTPKEAKKLLMTMFSQKEVSATLDKQKYGEVNLKNKRRQSFFEVDIPFSTWLCSFLTKDYAGYAANAQVKGEQAYFHLEFMFCNPFRWLKRNLANRLDWQRTTYDSAPKVIQQFITQLSYYKTTNLDFHAGNLLEHSIWSLLFAEQILASALFYVDEALKRRIAATAFIHDIGKMVPSEMIRRKEDYIYYAVPTHPDIGRKYILGELPMPLVDQEMNVVGEFPIRALLQALGFTDEDIPFVARLVEFHWEFGYFLQRWQGVTDMATVDQFIDRVGRNETINFFYSLVIISMADILAVQPYGVNNLTSELNHHSKYFPYIRNVPKKYRGGNLADLTANTRLDFAYQILWRVLLLQATPQQSMERRP